MVLNSIPVNKYHLHIPVHPHNFPEYYLILHNSTPHIFPLFSKSHFHLYPDTSEQSPCHPFKYLLLSIYTTFQQKSYNILYLSPPNFPALHKCNQSSRFRFVLRLNRLLHPFIDYNKVPATTSKSYRSQALFRQIS